jgi:hypothetical protein
MLTITNTTVTRDEVWRAFRRTHDVRLRERYHGILLLMDGKSCPEVAQWLYRDEDTVRGWVHAFNQEGLQGLVVYLQRADNWDGPVRSRPCRVNETVIGSPIVVTGPGGVLSNHLSCLRRRDP